jgi:hypothetical protein
VSDDDAFTAARAHLGSVVADEDVERYDDEAPYPTWWVAKGDDYQTSRLAIPGWLAAFADRVNGRPIAIAPERGQLIISGDGDARAVLRLAQMAQKEFQAASRAISPVVYTTDASGRVVPYEAPSGHPHADLVSLGSYLFLVAEYKIQTEHLQKRFDAEGTVMFVANYSAVHRNGQSPISYTTWAQNVVSMLPKADLLMIAGGKFGLTGPEWQCRIPWETFERIAPGSLSIVEGLDPPRFRAKWPSPAEVERIRAEAADPTSPLAP